MPRQVASVTTSCRASRIRLPPLMRSCTIFAYLLVFVRKPIIVPDRLQFGKVEDILNPTAATSCGCRMRADDEELLLRQIKFHDESLLAFSRSWRLLNFVSIWQVGSDLYAEASIWFVEHFVDQEDINWQAGWQLEVIVTESHLYLDFQITMFLVSISSFPSQYPAWWIVQMSCKISWLLVIWTLS